MNRFRLIFTALALAALSGCAAFGADAARVSVTEYGASGILTGSAVGGCVVEQSESKASAAGKSSMSVTVIYKGGKCSVSAQSR